MAPLEPTQPDCVWRNVAGVGKVECKSWQFPKRVSRGTDAANVTGFTWALTQTWQPPKGQVYKLNFDAAIFADLLASGVEL